MLEHYCGGQKRVLGVPAREVPDGFQTKTLPAEPNRCPQCGTVCREWTPTEIAAQKVAYEARGGVWGPNPKEPPVV